LTFKRRKEMDSEGDTD